MESSLSGRKSNFKGGLTRYFFRRPIGLAKKKLFSEFIQNKDGGDQEQSKEFIK